MLEKSIAEQILSLWDRLQIDMFASRLNKQLDRFESWKADPEAEFIDAFTCTLNWKNMFLCFSPFQYDIKANGEVERGQDLMPSDGIYMVYTDLVHHSHRMPDSRPIHSIRTSESVKSP